MMRLELLADRISLPLHRFALPRLHTHERTNPLIDTIHKRVPPLEVAAFGRSKIRVVGRGQQP